MINLLQNGVAWVTLRYSDDSVKVIKTSLNQEVLTRYGVKAIPGYFYDMRHGEYVKFREDVTDITVTKAMPEFVDEVINFANRFI